MAGGELARNVERSLLGTDHVEVGSAVARRWNFPPAIVDAIADHHRGGPGDSPAPGLAALLSQIHLLTGPLERGWSAEQALAMVPDSTWQALRVEPGERGDLLLRLSTSLAAIGQA